MKILIDNKEAVLKKGSSFDFIAENRLFTGADAYTLSITFPLRGCQQNLAIFGHINRKDHNLNRLLLDCEIHDHGFHAYGAVNIVDISETEVKTQFLQGRSVQNYQSDLDNTYINEIPIGPARDDGHFECWHYWRPPGSEGYNGRVSLPWVNNTSGNIQNKLIWRSGVGRWYYAGTSNEEDAALSCQYFLVYVLEKVLDYVEYSYDLTNLYYSTYKYLVIFNTFPFAWEIDEWGLALPHWTVTEFLEQVERFTNGVFTNDRNLRKMTFSFNADIIQNQKVVTLNNIIDEHQVELSDKKNASNKYLEQQNIKYSEADHTMQKFYSCEWVKGTLPFKSYTTLQSLRNAVAPYLETQSFGNIMYRSLLYAADVDTYFVLRYLWKENDPDTHKPEFIFRLLPVNMFAPRIINRDEDAQFEELSIVPVCIDHTDEQKGDCVFLECGTYGDEDSSSNITTPESAAVKTLLQGEPQKKEEYFDKLYVGFWNGDELVQGTATNRLYPIPWIDNLWIDQNGRLAITHMDEQEDFSMRLSGKLSHAMLKSNHRIDETKKFTFKFLVDNSEIPEVQSIFYIHGKKYLAEKITATFTEDGMSQLCKMVAYRMTT